MNEFGTKPANADLSSIGLANVGDIYWNFQPSELIEEVIINGQGVFADTGALAIDTGEFTGRSPKDKFCVKDAGTEQSVWWGDINIADGKVQEKNFDAYRLLRMNEVPQIEVFLMDSDEKPGGMGEPATALVAPALCNAIYAATKKRLHSLPISKHGITV